MGHKVAEELGLLHTTEEDVEGRALIISKTEEMLKIERQRNMESE